MTEISPQNASPRWRVSNFDQHFPSDPRLVAANMERPTVGDEFSVDGLEISGWVLLKDPQTSAPVKVVIGGIEQAGTPVPRPDVAAAFPAISGALSSGFRAWVDLTGSPGTAEILVQVVVEGGAITLGTLTAQAIHTEKLAGTNSPMFTVIISCRDRGAFLDEAVQSVLDQSFDDAEIVIVDDGSEDPASLYLFASYIRPRTQILRNPRRGIASARNAGAREATGDILVFLDAEDRFEPGFLERVSARFQSSPELGFLVSTTTISGEVRPPCLDPPELFCRDSVGPALAVRRDAFWAAGGLDDSFPHSGYDLWDFAITLVERDVVGEAVGEPLYRDRFESQASFASAEEHASCFARLVRKHRASFGAHRASIADGIEQRTNQLTAPQVAEPNTDLAQLARRAAFLERLLYGAVEPESRRHMRPLLSLLDVIRRRPRGFPRISVVIRGTESVEQLEITVRSAGLQLSPSDEIVVWVGRSADAILRRALSTYRDEGIVVDDGAVTTGYPPGIRAASAPIIFAVDAGATFDQGLIGHALEILESTPTLSFVAPAVRELPDNIVCQLDSTDLPGVLSCPRVCFPVVRRTALDVVGFSWAAGGSTAEQASDLLISLVAAGHPGQTIAEAVSSSPGSFSGRKVLADLTEKHRALFGKHWEEILVNREKYRRRFELAARGTAELDETTELVPLEWGSFRRLEPVSRVWGLDRGEPVDRYYISGFLERNRKDIHGRVLDVKEPYYTQVYDGGVESTDIVDIATDNPAANIIADLASEGSLPAGRYDCFVLTQTIHIIYDISSVLRNAYSALKPGGVLLATLPCVSRIDYESGLEGDSWRFTPASARRLFEDVFGEGQVAVEAHGNVLTCCAFLLGLASAELKPEELDYNDPYFPLLLCVRAVKPQESRLKFSGRKQGEGKAAILLYHRIDQPSLDPWKLCVSPEHFEEHLDAVEQNFQPVRLSELAHGVLNGQVPHRAVAITFDDGYRDNLSVALPMLKQRRIPATFFLSGDGAAYDGSFWWEAVADSIEQLGLDDLAARELHGRLVGAGIEDRMRILEELPRPAKALPPRMTRADLIELATEPLVDVGAHGWSHRTFTDLSDEALRPELETNVDELVRTAGFPVLSFAYPFGGPETDQTRSLLRNSGILFGCVIGEEPVTAKTHALSLPRLVVSDSSGKELTDLLERLIDQ